jgi:hypothetical protein
MMPAEDVALALMMLDNEAVHWEVSHGEFGRLEGFELGEDERALLVEATREVVTRDEKVPVAFRPGDESVELSGPGGPERGFGYWPPGTAEAIKYVQEGLGGDPRLQASFVAWQEVGIDILP